MRRFSRTVLIGDVHGCPDELLELLTKCEVTSDDRVVLVGDLVAKGPDSQAVVALARERRMLGVCGNHDAAVLRFRRAERTGAKLPKLKPEHERVVESLKARDFAYLEALPLWLELPELGAVVVHAGIDARRSLAEQQADDLLNMRSVRSDGSPSKRLEDGELWALHYAGPKHVVFGHNAVTGLQRHPFATGLDTGCVYGRSLTALVLPERRLVSVDARRTYKPIEGVSE